MDKGYVRALFPVSTGINRRIADRGHALLAVPRKHGD